MSNYLIKKAERAKIKLFRVTILNDFEVFQKETTSF